MSAPESRAEDGALPARMWPALLLLGFSSGLPQPLVDSTLSAWLKKVGYSPADIVLLGYVTLPFSLKVLWAPLVDRFVPRWLGRRRGWLLACQIAVLLGVGAMAAIDPSVRLASFLVAAMLASFAAATQDLVVNGYTCEAFPPERLAGGAGLLVWGYRLAWLISGGLALVVADRWGWGAAYVSMGLFLALGIAGTFLAPEPERAAPPATLRSALVEPLLEWRRTLGLRTLVWLLFFGLFYRLPDLLANLLAVPFQTELYPLEQLGYYRSIIGLIGAALGVAVASWSIPRVGMMRALWLFGFLQALSNLGYVGLDQHWWGGLGGLIGVLLVENVCGALAATVFVAYLMSFCRSASAATQYALLTTVTLLGPHLFRQPIHDLMERLGWSGFFLLTTAAVLPIVLLLSWMRPLPDRT